MRAAADISPRTCFRTISTARRQPTHPSQARPTKSRGPSTPLHLLLPLYRHSPPLFATVIRHRHLPPSFAAVICRCDRQIHPAVPREARLLADPVLLTPSGCATKPRGPTALHLFSPIRAVRAVICRLDRRVHPAAFPPTLRPCPRLLDGFAGQTGKQRRADKRPRTVASSAAEPGMSAQDQPTRPPIPILDALYGTPEREPKARTRTTVSAPFVPGKGRPGELCHRLERTRTGPKAHLGAPGRTREHALTGALGTSHVAGRALRRSRDAQQKTGPKPGCAHGELAARYPDPCAATRLRRAAPPTRRCGRCAFW